MQFDTGVHGIVLDLKRDSVGVVLLGSEDGLHEGSAVGPPAPGAGGAGGGGSSERLRVWYRVNR